MRNIKLLYVDDEEDIREIVEFALEDEGFELRTCGSGDEALGILEGFDPDIVLLDVMMPGLDGPGTLKALRGVPGMTHIPVAFCTAKARPEEVSQLLDLGAVEVVKKPFEAMELADHIRAICERSHA